MMNKLGSGRRWARWLGREGSPGRAEPPPGFDFDGLARDLAAGLSRREALRRLGLGLGGAMLAAVGLETRAWSDPPGCGTACHAATGFQGNAPASVKAAFVACVNACGACKDEGGAPCIAAGGAVACCSGGQSCCSGICCNTSTDVHNCGGCGHGCTTQVANATPTCRSGACSFNCITNYTLCSGACVDTQSDNHNCGSCSNACGPNHGCCSGTCTDLTMATHCGTCGNDCMPPNPDCCPNTSSAGGYACTNTFRDAAHCGNCDTRCPSGNCSNGMCCPSGQTNCGGTCVDTSTDNNNCGGCGVTCPGTTSTCCSCQNDCQAKVDAALASCEGGGDEACFEDARNAYFTCVGKC